MLRLGLDALDEGVHHLRQMFVEFFAIHRKCGKEPTDGPFDELRAGYPLA